MSEFGGSRFERSEQPLNKVELTDNEGERYAFEYDKLGVITWLNDWETRYDISNLQTHTNYEGRPRKHSLADPSTSYFANVLSLHFMARQGQIDQDLSKIGAEELESLVTNKALEGQTVYCVGGIELVALSEMGANVVIVDPLVKKQDFENVPGCTVLNKRLNSDTVTEIVEEHGKGIVSLSNNLLAFGSDLPFEQYPDFIQSLYKLGEHNAPAIMIGDGVPRDHEKLAFPEADRTMITTNRGADGKLMVPELMGSDRIAVVLLK